MNQREHIAWAAGFWDGEGSTVLSQPSKPCPRFTLEQAGDEPIALLRRFVEAVGVPAHIYPKRRRELHHKDSWVVVVNGFENVQALVAICWNYLSITKRQQAARVLNQYVSFRRDNHRNNGAKIACRHGHALAGANLRVSRKQSGRTERVCRACRRASSARRRQSALTATVTNKPT